MALLKIQNISKYFPGVKALNNISMDILEGEVHAICGENGAGKSTLMNILTGNLQPDEGEIFLDDQRLKLKNPKTAFQEGISIVHQHLSLFDNLSIGENIFANQHPKGRFGAISYSNLHRATKELLGNLNIALDPRIMVVRLSAAQKQMVEIAKALAKKPRILILDEPTASVTDKEVATIFRIIRQLKQERVSIIYISHRLNEIFDIADRVTVFKDGNLMGTFPVADIDRDRLIKLMVGRDLAKLEHKSAKQPHVLLETKNLSNKYVRDLNLKLHKGEILGMSGLVGAGRSEIARLLFGADPATKGQIFLDQQRIVIGHPSDAIRRGIVYLPEDRRAQSLFPQMSIENNMFSSSLINSIGWINKSGFKDVVNQYMQKLRVASPNLEKLVSKLSGGNQQKVFLAKWLLKNPQVLILDEPTHGIDVGAKYDFYNIIRDLAREGRGIIMISSEMPELLGLCDTIAVVREKRIVGILPAEEATEERILKLAMIEK
jgi:ABC-type sugar transport system ATPase subunit